MDRCRGATFKEYIQEELACFSKGISRDMNQHFGFVKIMGGAYHDVTNAVMMTTYNQSTVVA
jgi:hypothetical protein